MCSISPSILRGLSTLVPDAVNYVCLVEYDNIQWYLALGRKSIYFIDKELNKFKDPPIPYNKIEACRLCSRRKTLMQIQLKIDRRLAANKESSDPKIVLERKLCETYGPKGILNLYSQDRKAAVDSFRCYWQIDQMIISRNFGSFPLVENVKIQVDDEEDEDEDDSFAEKSQNLKKQHKLPPVFFAPDFNSEYQQKVSGYRIFVSNMYTRKRDKECEFVHKDQDCHNKITFQVKDQVPIDFLDRMPDKDRDLKLLCE